MEEARKNLPLLRLCAILMGLPIRDRHYRLNLPRHLPWGFGRTRHRHQRCHEDSRSSALTDLVRPDELGPEKIIPSSLESAVAAATARAAMESGIARVQVAPEAVAENLRQRLARQEPVQAGLSA